MQSERTREAAAGAVFILAGLFFAGFALAQLRLGTFAKMGPGMFPFLIGAVLILVGIGHVAVTLTRPASGVAVEPVEWRSLIFVVLAMVIFTGVIAWFGMVPAIFALVFVAANASHRLTPKVSALLAVGLSGAAWLIFIRLLGLPLTLIKWPF